MFLPLQGGGQAAGSEIGGWGIYQGAPCVQRPYLWVRISLLKGGKGGLSIFIVQIL